jgi:hypothetical protein
MDNVFLKEWKAFCEAPYRSKVDDFYTLFMESISIEELNDIFKCVPQGDLLKPRLARLKCLSGNSNPIKGDNRQQEIEKITRHALSEKSKLMTEIKKKDLAKIIDNVTFRWVSYQDYSTMTDHKDSWVKGEVQTLAGDYFRTALGNYSYIIFAFMEATYGLTSDYNMVWYFLTPLMDVNYDPESDILLRENGIYYVITPDEVLLYDSHSLEHVD